MSVSEPFVSKWSSRYRGATILDLDPPPALSLFPTDPISLAMLSAFERDFTHLTVVDAHRALLGYISIPHLQEQLQQGKVRPEDHLHVAMTRFKRKGRKYTVITMDTPLEDLEAFFQGYQIGEATDGEKGKELERRGEKQDFAVITDEKRRFVLGVATASDLEEFAKRRPA